MIATATEFVTTEFVTTFEECWEGCWTSKFSVEKNKKKKTKKQHIDVLMLRRNFDIESDFEIEKLKKLETVAIKNEPRLI